MRSSCHPLFIYYTCKPWVTEVKDNGKRCLDARWRDQGSRVYIELGVQELNELDEYGRYGWLLIAYLVMLQGIDSGVSRVDSLSILERKYGFLSRSSRFTRGVNRFVFAQRPKLPILNQFVMRRNLMSQSGK
ncbi:hypothetical protein PIB30_084023 [Stylosanthes scabra]|uniref:Uncharacterized protein n=1 Tax=Stylosanthes scabra TaxID=79078 RepID=A0ABU6XTI7_9FABA|nr:hypothetical protein [Stylosanthes scabra]